MAQVIFLQNIRGVAQIGDVKKVADGYARNFLLPRKLAVLATEEALKTVKVLKQKRLAALEKDKDTALALVEKLKEFTLRIERTASAEGTLYDGLDATEVSSYLKKNHLGLEPEAVLLQEPIKKIGEYAVEVDLGFDVKTTLKIEVKKIED
jgi:large subunit ribosomal protein L9